MGRWAAGTWGAQAVQTVTSPPPSTGGRRRRSWQQGPEGHGAAALRDRLDGLRRRWRWGGWWRARKRPASIHGGQVWWRQARISRWGARRGSMEPQPGERRPCEVAVPSTPRTVTEITVALCRAKHSCPFRIDQELHAHQQRTARRKQLALIELVGVPWTPPPGPSYGFTAHTVSLPYFLSAPSAMCVSFDPAIVDVA